VRYHRCRMDGARSVRFLGLGEGVRRSGTASSRRLALAGAALLWMQGAPYLSDWQVPSVSSARACAAQGSVGLLRAATTASSVRVVGGVVTHFLWVSPTTARFRCRLEPGVRAPAPRPAPPRPRPAPRAPSRARRARGARSGARGGRARLAPAPPPAALPAGPFPAPLAFAAPRSGRRAPALLPSGPPRPAPAARLPQAPPPLAFLWTDAQTPAGG
jgi:hypothetical protein